MTDRCLDVRGIDCTEEVERSDMAQKVNWKKVEEIGEGRILWALSFAMNGDSVQEIARKTGLPESSLQSIKKDGPFAHRKGSRTSAH